MIVPCECGARLKIDDEKVRDREVRVRCPRCGNVLTASKPSPAAPSPSLAAFAPAPSRAVPAAASAPAVFRSAPLVLVAHDSDVVREMVGGVLLDAGFRVEHAADGVEALAKSTEQRPQAMVLDVGLPGIYGFELCERLKGDPATSGIKIVLLASVYGITRYKRMPTSLYGADDYIEKHHIADALVNKLTRMLLADDGAASLSSSYRDAPSAENFEQEFFRPDSLAKGGAENPEPAAGLRMPGLADRPPAASAPQPSPESQAIAPESFSLDASIFEKEECDIPRVEETDPEAVEKAKRFARIIVSDIALYNQEAVIEGVRNGTFYDLLKDDVEEGRLLFEDRVPQAIRARRDYYTETIENFIAAQKKIVH